MADPNARVEAAFLTKRLIRKIVDVERDDWYHLDAQRLGKGGFSSVFRVTLNGTSVALKVVYAMPGRDTRARQYQALAKREVDVLKSLKHPHIVQFKNAFAVNNLTITSMELCTQSIERLLQRRWEQRTGRSRDTLEKSETGWATAEKHEVMAWMSQVASALVYLHGEEGIVHCDVKADNVLLDQNGLVKVADFGLAFYPNKEARQGPCGTVGYRAPEMEWEEYSYGHPVDIFASGAMTYCMLFGNPSRSQGLTACQCMNAVEVKNHNFFVRRTGVKRTLDQVLEDNAAVVDQRLKRAKDGHVHSDDLPLTPCAASPANGSMEQFSSGVATTLLQPCAQLHPIALLPTTPTAETAGEDVHETKELDQTRSSNEASISPTPLSTSSVSESSSAKPSLPAHPPPRPQLLSKSDVETSEESSLPSNLRHYQAADVSPARSRRRLSAPPSDNTQSGAHEPIWLETCERGSKGILEDLPPPSSSSND
ncbi:Cell cycle serine/threonine-protein kinase cdc5/MSD2 [Mortierella sp. 14UC]|nr:Cell cycle serine/threonine-protein kinase cdc5/MSD2 [Mortierella sp. 14UC]